ncbi:MAG: hypothetical protein H7098_05215 [Oligoflexus sp.]|nr:hypothetical protein [Pseudopedobacter sp.]
MIWTFGRAIHYSFLVVILSRTKGRTPKKAAVSIPNAVINNVITKNNDR